MNKMEGKNCMKKSEVKSEITKRVKIVAFKKFKTCKNASEFNIEMKKYIHYLEEDYSGKISSEIYISNNCECDECEEGGIAIAISSSYKKKAIDKLLSSNMKIKLWIYYGSKDCYEYLKHFNDGDKITVIKLQNYRKMYRKGGHSNV